MCDTKQAFGKLLDVCSSETEPFLCMTFVVHRLLELLNLFEIRAMIKAKKQWKSAIIETKTGAKTLDELYLIIGCDDYQKMIASVDIKITPENDYKSSFKKIFKLSYNPDHLFSLCTRFIADYFIASFSIFDIKDILDTACKQWKSKILNNEIGAKTFDELVDIVSCGNYRGLIATDIPSICKDNTSFDTLLSVVTSSKTKSPVCERLITEQFRSVDDAFTITHTK